MRRHLTSLIQFNLQNQKSPSWLSVSGPKKRSKSVFSLAAAPLHVRFGANMHLADGSSLSYSHSTAISCFYFAAWTRSPALCLWDQNSLKFSHGKRTTIGPTPRSFSPPVALMSQFLRLRWAGGCSDVTMHWNPSGDRKLRLKPDTHRVLTALQERMAARVKWRLCITFYFRLFYFCALTHVDTFRYTIKLHASVFLYSLLSFYSSLFYISKCPLLWELFHFDVSFTRTSPHGRLPVWRGPDGPGACTRTIRPSINWSTFCLASPALDVFSLSPIL